MALFTWIDGKIVPDSQAKIPVTDSAYLYGIGLFETVKVSGKVTGKASEGRILLWERHFQRLSENARRVTLRLPLGSRGLEKAVLSLVKKNRLKEATVRMMLSETDAGTPRLVITAKPFQAYPQRCYAEGARTMFARTFSADTKTLSRIKTTSYLSKMIPRREATARGMDEALMVNEDGFVTEGASSNLFIVKNGILITTPLNDGLLPGTRRRLVIELAKILKIPVKEKSLRPGDLYQADEVFITSSLKDVMPVGFLEKKKLGDARSITQRLQNIYRIKLQPEA